MKYIKQLDSIRAIAVIFVIISHWTAEENVINEFQIGPIGVNIFFVLSGFLITWILFEYRDKAESLHSSKTAVLKNFYFRRTLRIFPIYYLTIFVLLLFHKSTDTNIQSAFLYYLTYTSNFYLYKMQAWDGMLSHFWSLAVEEQFYLIWPWIILFINKKYFLPVIVCFILIGTISQIIFLNIEMGFGLTFTCFDSFGLGALLSWQITQKKKGLNKFYSILTIIASLALVIFVLDRLGMISYVPFRTIVSIIALWVVTYIMQHQQTNKLKFKFILNNPILIFIGKISYGIYVYHLIIPSFYYKILSRILPEAGVDSYWVKLFLLQSALLLLLISWLSYILIEKRFLVLKKHFSYLSQRKHDSTYA